MESGGITERVRQFIFEYIDSVEQLEILLHLRLIKGEWQDAEKISRELRLSADSVRNRLLRLQSAEIVSENSAARGEYCYSGQNLEIESILIDLSEAYRLKKHRILELIFSPTKRARNFANAFNLKQTPSSGEENG